MNTHIGKENCGLGEQVGNGSIVIRGRKSSLRRVCPCFVLVADSIGRSRGGHHAILDDLWKQSRDDFVQLGGRSQEHDLASGHACIVHGKEYQDTEKDQPHRTGRHDSRRETLVAIIGRQVQIFVD